MAEPEPEPVAVGHLVSPYGEWKPNFNLKCKFPAESLEWSIPLYFHPPARRSLTDEEIDKAIAQERDALLDHVYEYGTTAEGVLRRVRRLARAVERAHGIGGNDE